VDKNHTHDSQERIVKVRWPHYWVDMEANTSLLALVNLLARTRLKVRWNHQLSDCTGRTGFIEIYPK